MEYPNPVYRETKQIKSENVNEAVERLIDYMRSNMFLIRGGYDMHIRKAFGLTKENSLVEISGLKPEDEWQTCFITVVNMNKDDSKLIQKLLEIAETYNNSS